MPTYVALLRAVNLAGRNVVGMGELRALAESLGYADGRTLLQSGNLVFTTPERSAVHIEDSLQKGASERLAVNTDFFVRSRAEWQRVIAENPFRDEAEKDPGHLLVVVLKEAPAEERVRGLQDAISGRERVQAKGRQLYAVYPDGVGRSRLTMAVLEKKLGTRGTGRNWNTVLKLGAIMEEKS